MAGWSAQESGLAPQESSRVCLHSLLNAAGVWGHLLFPGQGLGAVGFGGCAPSGTSPKPLGEAGAKEKGPALPGGLGRR